MPEINLSPAVPPDARWIKLRYEITAKKTGARLIARVWSGTNIADAVNLEGSSGEVTMPLDPSRRINYQFPVTVQFKLKLVAYSTSSVFQ